jgi:hypothetical protein
MSQNDRLDNLDIAVSDSLLGQTGAKPAITISVVGKICNTDPNYGCPRITTSPGCK